MKISLITATYNSEKNIRGCLQSVTEQTYNNIEHIVVDGGSNDETLNIVRSFASVPRYISEPDKGIYDALNKGIKQATGDMIGFLHSDDIFASKNTIQKIYDTFNNKNIDGVYGDLVLVSKDNPNKIIRKWYSQQFDKKLLEKGWMPAHPTLFLRKSVYEKHGLFDLSYKISADYDFMLRVFQDSSLKFIYLPEVITKMRIGGTSNGSLIKLYQKTKEDYNALKKNKIPNPKWALLLKKVSKIVQYL